MTRLDSHWTIKGDTAQAALEAQGYEADRNARGRKGWVLMVKKVEDLTEGADLDGDGLWGRLDDYKAAGQGY